MSHMKIVRVSLLLIIALIICMADYTSVQFSQVSCLEVMVLSDEDEVNCRELTDIDLSTSFLFKSEPAAVDQKSRTIYISQRISENMHFQDLEGALTLAYKDFRLYFAPDPNFSDLKSAIANGHRFRLLAVNPDGKYIEYYVVFTALPVIHLFEHTSGNGWNFTGNFCLWTPDDPEHLRYSVKTSSAAWHVRGGATTVMPKKSWKLTLTSKGASSGLSLLGLGKDDDWILNGMSLDDTALKEQLFMMLWNQMASETPYDYPMSTGEYVEVIVNQEYQGIYLLQRRIDNRYLDLPADSILVKGLKTHKLEEIQNNYEIVHSPFSDEDTYPLLEDIWNGDCSMFDIDNFVDVSLFLHFASATDNSYIKNIFYVLNNTPSGYALSLIPWDTDMSFGVVWGDGGFSYNYERSMDRVARRMEFDSMAEIHPDLYNRLASRWQELRKTVLSEENILSELSRLEAQLADSSVPVRESQRWDKYYGGNDTVENLYRYIHEKLPLIDAYYAQY